MSDFELLMIILAIATLIVDILRVVRENKKK